MFRSADTKTRNASVYEKEKNANGRTMSILRYRARRGGPNREDAQRRKEALGKVLSCETRFDCPGALYTETDIGNGEHL
jgi:hypothetical protein